MQARNAGLLRWAGVVTIIAAAWCAFAPALRGNFLWDDHSELTSNAEIKARDGLGKIWRGEGTLDYFPLKSSVQWVQWRLWGERPLGYHVTNLMLHMMSALLVWRLLTKLGVTVGWIGGLLFAVHPLTVESVAWIAELKNVLSLPPLLLAAIAFIDFTERRSATYLAASLAYFLAAVLCKSSVVMLPVVLLVYVWWRKSRLERGDVLATLPYFAVSLVLGLVTIWFQHERAIAQWQIEMGSGVERAGRALGAVAFYATKSFWPGTQLPIYPRATVESAASQAAALFGFAVLLGWAWRHRSTWGRHALLGLSWFLLHLIPVLGLVKMSFLYFSWVSEHFAYLPLVGVAGLAAAGCDYFWRQRTQLRPLVAAVVASVALLAIMGTRAYAVQFTSEQTLWRYTLRHNPDAWIAHSNLAVPLLLERRLEEALEHAETAVRLKPDYASAHANAVNALANLGRTDATLAAVRRAEQNNATSAELYASGAIALLRAGRYAPSIELYQRAIALKPGLVKAHREMGVALYLSVRLDEAIASYERGLALAPDADTHANCGVALVARGRVTEAIRHYEAALRLAPDHLDARYNLGVALVRAHEPAAGLESLEQVLERKPDHAEAHFNRGEALVALGRRDEARIAFETALRWKPTLTEARQQLDKLK
jgi:protein O-mannosyl-transferase